MGMKRVTRTFPDYSDELTFSQGSYAAAHPVSNAGDVRMGRVARTSDLNASSMTMRCTLSTIRPLELFGLSSPNATPQARWRVTLFDASGVELASSGWLDFIQQSLTYGEVDWLDARWWSLRPSLEDIQDRIITAFWRSDNRHRTQYFDVDFRDDNNPDGVFDVSRVMCGQAWELMLNPNYGATFGFRSRSNVFEADGGAKSIRRRPKPRVWSGSVETAGRTETFERAFEHQWEADLDKTFLWIPEPDRNSDHIRQVFVARNSQLSPFTYANFSIYDFPVAVEEVI